jgi:katanin p80 WD40 repeat-containing subunit B1
MLQVLVDVLSVLMERTELLTLEICCMLVPLLNGLLNSDNDRNLITALSLLLKLVTTFGPVINTTRASAPSLGVDLQAEQRLERCVMCYHELQTVGHCLLPLMRRGGEIASLAKELRSALERV